MRAPVVALALVAALSQTARADSFVELGGGVMIPVSDDQWTDYVESGPKLAARVGAMGQRAGALLSLDWTPVNADDMGFGTAVDVSSHRFRILLGGTGLQKVGPKLHASLRAEVGVDIAYVSVHTNILGFENDSSDTDVGLALEVAGGLWFDVGSVQIGGELALPISYHDDGADNDIDLEEYTSFDVDILFGVRFVSK